ncbi:LOW QUALITY PROTEIN: hypothetical protein OOU_Y34scaffold00258g2 [Pyricularia oryzae Y34]|uniref:Uncharacterized protein n=1 Tax=Pyricularia oryzae (strain Y34) TaxID=1143189 RepID=A0AA97P458_PYRO3|nr:LOW QUALITY PROTEIN: hypothetical protein OOU_Y34scaffold00258g2 [Pyricularia oryzae Y34]
MVAILNLITATVPHRAGVETPKRVNFYPDSGQMSSHFKKDPGAAPGGFSRPPESGMTGAAFTVFTPNVHAGPTACSIVSQMNLLKIKGI